MCVIFRSVALIDQKRITNSFLLPFLSVSITDRVRVLLIWRSTHFMMLTEYLTQSQLFGLVGLAVLFWAAAALKIRYAAHICYSSQMRQVSTFLMAIPVGYVLIRFTEFTLHLNSKQRLISTVIMCATALLMDGVAFMWFPKLYENPLLTRKNAPLAMAFSRMGAASILWGVGILLGIALLTNSY